MGSISEELPSGRIKEVAVIGAGISGITAAAHLLRQGIHVVVFERSSIAGGVWNYDPRPANEPEYPNILPPTPNDPKSGFFSNSTNNSKNNSWEEAALNHAPPGPCYFGLRNNVPTTLMRSTLLDWPKDTAPFVSQDLLHKYILNLAAHTGVQQHIRFDTSVETVAKDAGSNKWFVRTRTFRKTGAGSEFLGRRWEFDAAIVASGHYHEPKIPQVTGLKEWKQKFPQAVTHSKLYRSPEALRGKTVFIVGGGVSSLDIVTEAAGIAKKIYQSTRSGKFDLPVSMLPKGVERVGAIDRVEVKEDASSSLGRVILKDGKVFEDVDAIILGTGYITSYPYLGELQNPTLPVKQADDKVIITADGQITHNLHKDIFYIPDPTLAFVGVPYHTSTFSLFDFQSEIVARVLAGKAVLPDRAARRTEYQERKTALGEGVDGSVAFHSLMGKDAEYMGDILGWVNVDAARLGHEPMRGVDEKWLADFAVFFQEMKKRRDIEKAKDEDVTLWMPNALKLATGLASA
jgi:cation diffusion facilitator CzcD-associated flavoprotein CzcO